MKPSDVKKEDTFHFEMTASYSELERFYEEFESSEACRRMPAAHGLAVKLSFDELVSNVIKFAGEKGFRIILDLYYHPVHGLQITLEDNSPAFDPWAAQLAPNLGHETEEDDLEEVAIGGRGLFMVRQMMDSASHSVVNGWNCNIMTKSAPAKL
ncbi:MAG: ATP-binding protein [Verrucomicrobiales bacterium]|nr:ATP-binding protein [Verrucomicrobiae bacterium]